MLVHSSTLGSQWSAAALEGSIQVSYGGLGHAWIPPSPAAVSAHS